MDLQFNDNRLLPGDFKEEKTSPVVGATKVQHIVTKSVGQRPIVYVTMGCACVCLYMCKSKGETEIKVVRKQRAGV